MPTGRDREDERKVFSGFASRFNEMAVERLTCPASHGAESRVLRGTLRFHRRFYSEAMRTTRARKAKEHIMASKETVETKKVDPSSNYSRPDEVLNDKRLGRDAKIAILREWYYDAMRLQDATAENMSGGEPDRLQSVSDALLKLGVSPVKEQDPNAQPEPSPLRKLVNAVTRPRPGNSAD